MENLGKITQLIVTIGDWKLAFNLDTILMTWIAITVLLVFGALSARGRKRFPGPLQSLGELLVDIFYGLSEDALGKKLAQVYAPLITALFMFLLVSNWLGIIPHLHEPTKDLNTPLSLGLIGFFIAHYAGIRVKGLKEYSRAYIDPMFFMLPLNLIGEIAKVVSISFRLFGNIMGGSIIILVVSYLSFNLVLPPFLNAFFGLFVGTVQAFVFTMLTLVYISVQVQ
jgi:F-type H+-transporting ATPase subunit a